jgi:hypothetical protein
MRSGRRARMSRRHLVPRSVLAKIPPRDVPAKTVPARDGRTASTNVMPPPGSLPEAVGERAPRGDEHEDPRRPPPHVPLFAASRAECNRCEAG